MSNKKTITQKFKKKTTLQLSIKIFTYKTDAHPHTHTHTHTPINAEINKDSSEISPYQQKQHFGQNYGNIKFNALTFHKPLLFPGKPSFSQTD